MVSRSALHGEHVHDPHLPSNSPSDSPPRTYGSTTHPVSPCQPRSCCPVDAKLLLTTPKEEAALVTSTRSPQSKASIKEEELVHAGAG